MVTSSICDPSLTESKVSKVSKVRFLDFKNVRAQKIVSSSVYDDATRLPTGAQAIFLLRAQRSPYIICKIMI